MDDHDRLMKACEERNLDLKVVEVDGGGYELQVCGPRGGVRATESIGDGDASQAIHALLEALEG